MKKNPSRLALWLYKIASDEETGENAVGDLTEEYNLNVKTRGHFFAWFVCWRQVIVALLSNLIYSINWSFVMLKNYLKVAVRNIKRQKGYSFINIFGLSIGLACFIIISLWVKDELSYDKYHENIDNIYLVAVEHHSGDNVSQGSATPAPLAAALKENYPEIKNAAHFVSSWPTGKGRNLIGVDDNKFFTNNLFLTEPAFFEIFTIKFLQGTANSALEGTNSIVLTESVAKKIFGNINVLGKLVDLDDKSVIVGGVIEDPPDNSDFSYEVLLSSAYVGNTPNGFFLRKWDSYGFRTYVLLEEGANIENINRKIKEHIIKANPRWAHRPSYISLYPAGRLHLHNIGGGGLIVYIYVFSVIGFFVLLLACINYMNLATAKSVSRIKEIGLRKVVGSTKAQLIRQFLGESFLFSFIGLFLALVFVLIFLPTFNNIAGKNIRFDFTNYSNLLIPLLTALAVAFIAGSYPAFYLSSFKPVQILKKSMFSGDKSAVFRKILVVLQFTISIALMTGMAVVYSQINYMRNAEIGFNKENIIYFSLEDNSPDTYKALKGELLKNSNILNVTVKSALPLFSGSTSGTISWEGKDPKNEINWCHPMVDYDYFRTLNMQIAEGRDFSEENMSDMAEAFILNEEAVRQGNIENPLGKRIQVNGENGYIIGVVKNAKLNSLRSQISPEVYHLSQTFTERYSYVIVKLRRGTGNAGERISGTLGNIENIWKKFYPASIFEYNFLDEAIDNLYRAEIRISSLLNYFTLIAVIISCLGLFGLSLFMMERRTKEIAIRKINGSSQLQIIKMLSGDSLKWVLIANIFAWPVSYYFMRKWLQDFAFRINLSIFTFILIGIAALLIAFLTVSYQSVKSAKTRPVQALRCE